MDKKSYEMLRKWVLKNGYMDKPFREAYNAFMFYLHKLNAERAKYEK